MFLLGVWLASVPARADVALDRGLHPAALELASGQRGELPSPIPVAGPWRLVGTVGGVRSWEAPLPVRPRSLFFYRAPDDMALFDERGATVRFASGLAASNKADTWAYSEGGLTLRRAAREGAPGAGQYSLRYGRAVERERELNHELTSLSDQDFVFRSLQVGPDTRHGIYLPAPGRVVFDLDLSPGSVLELGAQLIPPELVAAGDLPSNGAALVIKVDDTELRRVRLGELRDVRVQLPAGQHQLELATDPLGDPRRDYVFLSDPVVRVPQEHPPRVVMVFIDTLRQDHLGVYGYQRDTTPHIDAWAQGAAIFDQARSTSPWTLPSTRTLVSGQQPEAWDRAPTLQDRLARAGWATGMFVGNIYLSSNFGMSEGWGVHHCVNWPLASVQVDRVLDFLDAHDDRPAFAVLHFMDMHLPYTEPMRYRHRFAGDRPAALKRDEFHRGDVVRIRDRGPQVEQYVRDRYDNNLAYVDAELQRLFDALGPQDTVVVLADHGEEFWDHGGFEHGHTLYDELLHVPLILKGPGVQAGRYDAPVSLLDVAPSLAVAAGVSTQGMEGVPLQQVREQDAALRARPQAFGRPLYGFRAWGVLDQGVIYITRQGREERYALASDPGEREALDEGTGVEPAVLREAMAQALGRPVRVGYRLSPDKHRGGPDLVAELTVPGGIDTAWAAEDFLNYGPADAAVEGARLRARWDGGNRGAREVFVIPTDDASVAAQGLGLQVSVGDKRATAQIRQPAARFHGQGGTLGRARVAGRTVVVGYAVSPEPLPQAAALSGYDDEVAGELKALGYAE